MSATTFYDVVTRYTVQAGGAANKLDRLDRATLRATRSQGALHVATAKTGGAFRMVGRMMVPMMGGMLGVAAAGMAVHKTFKNLNLQMNSTLNLAAQINLGTAFSDDPIKNFNMALRVSRGLVRDLTKDAAKLPGELADFIGISSMISGAVMAGGGTDETIRKLTAKVALATPAAGGDFQAAGRQTMRILFGTGSVGDSTLLAMMMPIFRTMGIKDTTALNAMTATKRLKAFDEALGKFTDNPMFRSKVIDTFDTQMGSLADNLFGQQGVMGQLGSPYFGGLIEGLTDLNAALSNNMDSIVENFRLIGDVIVTLGDRIANNPILNFYASAYGAIGSAYSAVAKTGMRVGATAAGAVLDPNFLTSPIWDSYGRAKTDIENRATYRSNANFQLEQQGLAAQLGFGDGAKKFEPKVPSNQITQTFNIRLDLKSDDATDAVAIKIKDAALKAMRHPTTVQRALQIVPGRGVLRT